MVFYLINVLDTLEKLWFTPRGGGGGGRGKKGQKQPKQVENLDFGL